MASFRPRTLGEYFQVLWRGRLLFVLMTAIMLVSTFLVIGSLPDIYQSSASVVVAGKPEDRVGIGSRVTIITERINSRSFLELLIDRHNPYPDLPKRAIESAVGRMRRDIKIEPKYRGESPEMLNVSYRNADPAVARNVTTDLVSTFGKMNEVVQQQIVEQLSTAQSEMGEIESRLDQLGQQRAAAAARSRVADRLQSAYSSIRAQRDAAESSVETLSDRQYGLEQQIVEQKGQIAEQEKLVKTSVGDARSGSSYGVLLVRKAELEAQLKDYSFQYTDKNSKVIQTRSQLAEINRQIAQLDSAGGQDGGPANSGEARELRSLQRELARMQTELEITRRELDRRNRTLGRTPDVGPSGAPVAGEDSAIANIASESDTTRLRDRYNVLSRKQDSLQSMQTGLIGLEPGLFQLVEMPAQPRSPAGPDRFKLKMLALALALVVGFVVVGATEIPRLFRISDDRDVQYYLGAHVIALIPETFTPAEQSQTRRVLLARRLAVLLLAVVLVPAFIFLLNHLKIFQILASR